MRKQSKRKMFIFIAVIAIFLSGIAPSISLNTSASETAEEKYKKDVNEYIGDAESPEEVLSKVMNDLEDNPNPERGSFLYTILRLFQPGYYINNVGDGVIDSDLGKKDDFLYDGVHSCNPNEPNNLLNANCNIPNFTTSLAQNIVGPFTTPFNNASKTSAKAGFGLGVPVGITNVPVDPKLSKDTYTALELFGYDLKLITYNGEWDKITVSTRARMLSNFGIIDHSKMMGTAFFKSVQTGFLSLIQGFNFSSDRFGNPLVKIPADMVSAGLTVLVDTSELNVIATRAWKRERLNETLYNVYVLTDKEVLTETSRNFFPKWINAMDKETASSKALQEVLALNPVAEGGSSGIPVFTYDPELETPESIEAREKVETYNKDEQTKEEKALDAIEEYETNQAESGNIQSGDKPKEYEPKYKQVPEPVYYTEKEQLQEIWAVENEEFLDRARAQNLIPSKVKDLESYKEIVKEWTEKWNIYYQREFAAYGKTVQDLMLATDKKVYQENPYLDSRQAISHYACANGDGTPMRDSSGRLEYLYLKNNDSEGEHINPRCSKVRAPIGGGFFGDGWHIDRPVDTRHRLSVNNESDVGPLLRTVNSWMQSFHRSINSFVAKTTNVVLGFAFSPILSKLGIDVIISNLAAGFRDTIFFPMSALAAAVGGLLFFMQLLKNGSAWELVGGILVSLLIFVIGATFLLKPDATLKLADEWPSKLDNYVADIVLGNPDGSSYCSTGDSVNGIRSAQCNVWGTMVFDPWVQLQFGTGYNNLYAKGKAPEGANSFENSESNADLVGDAAVHMGGGVVVNNWALYQLSKTKSGSITDTDFSVDDSLGKVDKDLYRLVDLQAGPNNGEGTDSRFFNNWSGGPGNSGNLVIMLLTTMQALIVSFAIIGLGYQKIEASFIFALMLVFLPIMLLYSLFPKGKGALKEYLSTLGSLLLKRVLITVMLAAYLSMMSGIGASLTSLTSIAFLNIILSLVFIMYRKELLELISSDSQGDSMKKQIKEAASRVVPMSVKQDYQRLTARAKGMAGGALGGFMGARSYQRAISKDISNVESRINELSNKSSKKGLDKEELDTLNKLKVKREELLQTEQANKNDKTSGLLKSTLTGANHAGDIIGRREERKIRRSGYSSVQILRDTVDDVYEKGQKDIKDNVDSVELDVYKDLVSTGDTPQNTMTTSKELDRENAEMLLNPKIQKAVREQAEARREKAKENKMKNALSEKDLDMDSLREIVEARRQFDRKKNKVFDRGKEKERKRDMAERKDSSNVTSSAKEIKEQMIESQRKEKKNNDKD